MNIITLDFETFFTDALDARGVPYKFKKNNGPGCNTEDYVRHEWFEAHGCAIKFRPDLPAKWWNGSELPELFAQIKWDEQAVLAHHAQFDLFIMFWHYGIRPKFIFDTLSMARLMLGSHTSVSLESLRKHFGIPSKITPYDLFKNKHWHEMSPDVQKQVGDGACDEVESIWNIFCELLRGEN